MAFTQVTVTGNYQLPDGSAASGAVVFTPTAPMRNATATSETSVSAPVHAQIVAGALSVVLAATTDPGTTPVGVTYEVVEYVGTAVPRRYWLAVPHGGGTIDLDAATIIETYPNSIIQPGPAGPAGPAGPPGSGSVNTVNGDPGPAVVLTASSVGAQPSDADLTTIAGLTATTDSFMQAKASAWAARTIAQVKTDLSVVSLTGAETVAGIKTFSSEPVAPSLKVTGVTGAPNPGRFVGVTTSGAPTAGTFALGDFALTQNGQTFVCVAAGTPGVWVTPSDLRDRVSSGEEAMPRSEIASSAATIASGDLRLSYFIARKTETTTQIRVKSGTTAAAATPTLVRLGLYTIAATGDGTLVASTANDTSLFAATTTAYIRSWTAAYAKVAGQRYALGVIVVTAVATPTLIGSALGSTSTELALDPRLSGTIGGLSDLPATFLSTDVGATGNRIYGVVLP